MEQHSFGRWDGNFKLRISEDTLPQQLDISATAISILIPCNSFLFLNLLSLLNY